MALIQLSSAALLSEHRGAIPAVSMPLGVYPERLT
jgi:hypothetical protein